MCSAAAPIGPVVPAPLLCAGSPHNGLGRQCHAPQESPQELPFTAVVGGPFPVRSLSPVQLLYFQFTPERAITLPRGMWNVHFDLVEANILARDQNGNDALLFDFEPTRANLALQYGLRE
jgi:hypothetical protein